MRKTTFGPLLIAATLLAGCIPTEDPVLYTVPGAATDRRVSVPQQTISVREVSLPTYAANEEISVLVTGGQIAEDGNNLWADDPVRAVTLRLTRAIGDLTRRTVAADPWPYRAPAEVTVDVRLEEFVAEASGAFIARGQFYIAHEDPELLGRSVTFDLEIPYDPAGGYAAIAAARSQIIAALAMDIAQKGLR